MNGSAMAGLVGYWPLNETSGSTAPNLVPGGTNGTLSTTGATWVSDATRGQVVNFDGASGYVDAGMLPALAVNDNFTWSFWTYQQPSGGTAVALGNRYNSAGASDGNWIKFTPTKLEYVSNSAGTPVDYADIPNGQWVHNVVVKSGSRLMYYRNGVLDTSHIVTGVPAIAAVPFYMGGDKYVERWAGRVDDVALWGNALSPRMVQALTSGLSPTQILPVTDNFNASTINTSKWQVIDYGLESPTHGGSATMTTLVADTTTNPGQLTLGGQSSSGCCWAGATVKSVSTFDTTMTHLVSVDRVSVTGATHAYRSSLWIWGDDTHYFHFSQDVVEGGVWTWNARDDGGVGTSAATGSGNNISAFDFQDGNHGNVTMELDWIPSGTPGNGQIEVYLNGILGVTWTVSNFPRYFNVMLSGMPWGGSSTVTAVFDNFSMYSVPEPAAISLLALGGLAVLVARRRVRRR
jgi:hypothetical protein